MILENKRGQEEMVGFALIMIVVAVILLVFLSLSLKNPQKTAVESYEVESFIQSFLQYDTDCEDYRGKLSVQDLIFSCSKDEKCLDERNSCEVLDLTLSEISNSSWKTGNERPVKGYVLNITSNGEEILSIIEGNKTNNYKGGYQGFPKRGELIDITFSAYY